MVVEVVHMSSMCMINLFKGFILILNVKAWILFYEEWDNFINYHIDLMYLTDRVW